MILRTYLLSFILVFISCSKKSNEQRLDSNGYWQQLGYGKFIELQDSTIKVYDYCKVDCHLSAEEHLLDFGSIKSISQDTLIINHGPDEWVFHRISRIPDRCFTYKDSLNDDPIYNFETFWYTFKENYCSFDVRGVDWDQIYQDFSPRVTSETSDLELYLILEEMVAILNDGHVSIEIQDEFLEEYRKRTESNARSIGKLEEWQIMEDLAEIYVNELKSYNGGMVRWGKINDNMGYIQFNSMIMVADYNLDQGYGLVDFYNNFWGHVNGVKDEVHRQDEVEGSSKILQRVIHELKGTESVVLDLRFNGGGKDGVALNVISHFTEGSRKVASKRAYRNSEQVPPQDLYTQPITSLYKGKVFILTSPRTASAAELTVLAALSDPGITIIGSNTEGIFSSTLDKTLPNGWEYELSNETYLDLQGNNYEKSGIPPHYPINYSSDPDEFYDSLKSNIELMKDEAIEQAIKLHGQNK